MGSLNLHEISHENLQEVEQNIMFSEGHLLSIFISVMLIAAGTAFCSPPSAAYVDRENSEFVKRIV